MRAAVRVHDWIPGVSGDAYAHRAVLTVRVIWGKIHSQEDYEDTERTSALDLGYSLMPVPIGSPTRTTPAGRPAASHGAATASSQRSSMRAPG
jgi:hypothetical protein